jgi:hypothetical protein
MGNNYIFMNESWRYVDDKNEKFVKELKEYEELICLSYFPKCLDCDQSCDEQEGQLGQSSRGHGVFLK